MLMQFTKKDTAAMKGVAICMMMLHHCFLGADRYAGYDVEFLLLGEYLTVLLAQFCKICVAVFVFISGYGITFSLKNTDSAVPGAEIKQIKKRWFSLMSGFWFVYILSFTASLILNPSIIKSAYFKGQNPLDCIFYILADFFGVSDLFGTPQMIGTWWYMSLAIIIICIMPIMYRLYKKYGSLVVFVLIFCINGFYSAKNYDMFRWFFILALGMICAEHNYLGKLKEFRFIKSNRLLDFAVKFIIYTPVLVFCIYLRQNLDFVVAYIQDGLIPLFVIIYCYTIVFEIPFVYKALGYIGKHSMNIFMSHTFLRAFYLKDFIHMFRYPFLIVTVLLLSSLLLSIIIELLKKYTGYNKLVKKGMTYITNKAYQS